MINCLAIDDEPLALELLEDNISKVPYLKLIAGCNDPIEGLSILENNKIDLVFLDIQMPGLTGLQFMQSITKKPMFILITAYEKYAIEGYNYDVIDYLVKPVPLERFIKACNKAKDLHELKQLQNAPDRSTQLPYFFVNADYSMIKVVFSDIQYVEGFKDYIKIHLSGSAYPLVVRMSMKSIEEQLPATTFLRVHKSFIVSKNYITSIRKNSIFIADIEIPVGENYRDAVNQLTGNSN